MAVDVSGVEYVVWSWGESLNLECDSVLIDSGKFEKIRLDRYCSLVSICLHFI